MAREPRPKAKPNPKPKPKPKPKVDDKAQFERFVETARKLGAEEVGQPFEETFKNIVKPVRPKSA